jgi:integrase
LRKPIGDVVGREPKDFADAKIEAKRAYVAWKDGKDPRDLLPEDAPTLRDLLTAYAERVDGAAILESRRKLICRTVVNGRAFGDYRGAEVTLAMIEAFQKTRPVVAGNRDLALLRATYNWAIPRGLVPSTPFKVSNAVAVKLQREEKRSRRLYPGEYDRLQSHASQYQKDVNDAALETACRQGELLSLQWSQVRDDIFLPAGKTKAKKDRRIPISSTLRAILERRRLDPAGEPLPETAFVFGDEIGRPLTWNKKGWVSLVLRANDLRPEHVVRVVNGRKRWLATLTPATREAYRKIGLHFHDLRREGASRWMDAGVPLGVIQRWLGHSNVAQTSTYLAGTSGGDEEAMRAFEAAVARKRQSPRGGRENRERSTTRGASFFPHISPLAGSGGSKGVRQAFRLVKNPNKSRNVPKTAS